MQSKEIPQLVEKLQACGLHNKTVTKFSEFFNNLCKELNQSDLFFELTKEFVALKTDLERMQYVWNIPQLRDIKFSVQREVEKLDDSGSNHNDGLTEYDVPDLITATAAIIASPYPHKSDTANADTLVRAYAIRAELLSRKGFIDDALKDIERALSFRCSPEACCFLQERIGKVYERSNQPDKAIEAYTIVKRVCTETKNVEMTETYDTIIKSLSKLQIGGEKPPSGRKGKCVKKTVLSEPKKHVCDKLSLELEDVNPSIPCASSAISIIDLDPNGKVLVAGRDIKTGELLIVESPYAYGRVPEEWDLTNCFYCLKHCYNPIPCFFCSDVAFCNEECRDIGWEEMHSVECNLLRYLSSDEENLIEIVNSLRIILRAGHKTLYGFYKNHSEGKKLEDLLLTEYELSAYLAVYNLSCQETFAMHQFRNSVYAYLCLCLLEQHTDFFLLLNPETDTEEFKIFVSSLLLRHLSNVGYKSAAVIEVYNQDVNVRLTSRKSTKPKAVTRSLIVNRTIGYGMFPLVALSNHSCDGNSCLSFHGRTAVMRSLRSIKQGEEITCEMIPQCSYPNQTKQKRREMILQRYKKLCECVACVQNYPSRWKTILVDDGIRLLNDPRKRKSNIARFKLKDPALFDEFRAEFTSIEPKLNVLREIVGASCSCPSALALAVSILEMLEKYCNRPNCFFLFLNDTIIRIYQLQGNCDFDDPRVMG